ncbi:MAG: DinB family protein [Pricia sp.]
MKIFLNQLFDYNFYCNKKLIETCSDVGQVPERSAQFFSHILNAHHLWNARIRERKPEYGVWQVHEVKAWGDIHYENQRNTFEIISDADDFEKRIDYENTEGRLFTNTLQDMLFHIVNHSTYHRGQIAIDFRANGMEPLVSDYIHYKR